MGAKVQMYVCGVTVYDYSHIGHARVYVAFDVLYRLLRHLQYDVQYVRNFTDVDDKIIARAAATGEDPPALSARFITEFHTDMQQLGCLAPTAEPKATDFIPAMVATINKIIDNGHAYALPDGDVYFDVASLPGYGRLSGRSQEDNRAGERVAVDSRKRSPADFALWKAAKPGEPAWVSPWGQGRPGWHIECSSMISELMGDVIDIHGGGRDLVFPHHENELAQSQAAAGPCSCGHNHQHSEAAAAAAAGSSPDDSSSSPADFVRFWLHNGFVNVDSEKMSKSLGNFFTIRDVLKLYHPSALRWFLLSSQYRAPVNYTQKALEDASARLFYVLQTLADVDAALQGSGEAGAAAVAAASIAAAPSSSASDSAAADAADVVPAGVGGELLGSVVAALLDDLNSPAAVSAMSAPLKAINDLLSTKAGRKNPKRLQLLAEYQAGLLASLQLLGLAVPDLAACLDALKSLALARAGLTQQEVEERIAARAAARAAKDFAAADAVRVELSAKGIMLMDSPEGTSWRPGLQDAE
ncbi:hypothetical protein OEZ85_008502 [Tetradesmus obliquus]|uniref:cysteine--tRNA ligase n=1 Tax=Tetradesmus obliquus TaxID=3088 RepID=A0ABY8TJ15_TETOB|nr:hypothetical protein OEZ85_008502 [Tetradesmus obliquus]